MAMKDPTSVSFLIHSSILITAGIYLSIRYVDLLEHKYKNIIYSTLITVDYVLLHTCIKNHRYATRSSLAN